MELQGMNIRLLQAILMWGSFGGICLAGVYFFLLAAWKPVLDYNFTLSPLCQFQIIVSFAFLLWTLGVIAADIIPTVSDSKPDPVRTGLLYGLCTVLVFTTILVFCDMVSHPSIMHYANDPFQIRMFIDRVFQQWLFPFAGFVLVSGILQALGAWCQRSRQKPVPVGDGHPDMIRTLYRHRFVLLALLAVLIIPPGLMYIAMGMGVPEGQSACCDVISDTVEVTRTGSDSIRIIMKPDLRVKHDPVPSVNIYLDEKDVSNQSVITRAHLDAIITPTEGLQFQRDAIVTLKGKTVEGNETVPVHLQIIATYPDKGIRYMICDMNL
jgi:hypothetical protein